MSRAGKYELGWEWGFAGRAAVQGAPRNDRQTQRPAGCVGVAIQAAVLLRDCCLLPWGGRCVQGADLRSSMESWLCCCGQSSSDTTRHHSAAAQALEVDG